MTTKTFAIINSSDISDLGKHKASGCTVLTYSALLTYCRNKTSCFPSIKTISEAIGGVYSVRQIQRALKFLEDNHFIKRNGKRSKERFVLLKRLVISMRRKSPTHLQGHKRRWNNKVKKTSFFKKGNNKENELYVNKSDTSKNTQKESEYRGAFQAEKIFSLWVIENPDKDITKLSTNDLAIIRAYLKQKDKRALDFREWMVDSWKDVFFYIKGQELVG